MDDNREDEHRYDDIIGLPHHRSSSHAPMAMSDRAAQFSPFAALTGYEDAVRETARLTEGRIELDDNAKELLDEALQAVQTRLDERPAVAITYFLADEKKSGGAYVRVQGRVKKIDDYRRQVVLADGREIPLADIIDLAETT
jgi:hypothetical protein